MEKQKFKVIFMVLILALSLASGVATTLISNDVDTKEVKADPIDDVVYWGSDPNGKDANGLDYTESSPNVIKVRVDKNNAKVVIGDEDTPDDGTHVETIANPAPLFVFLKNKFPDYYTYTNPLNRNAKFKNIEIVRNIHLTQDIQNVFSMQDSSGGGKISPINVFEGIDRVDTSGATDMAGMFANVGPANSYDTMDTDTLDISHFNMSSVARIDGMFTSTGFDKIILPNKFVDSKIKSLNMLFTNTRATQVNMNQYTFPDTSNVLTMVATFSSTKLSEYNVSSFNTKNVVNMTSMFGSYVAGAGIDTDILDLSNFDTSNIGPLGFRYMFANSNIKELNISSFKTNESTSYGMFESTGTGAYNSDAYLRIEKLIIGPETDLSGSFMSVLPRGFESNGEFKTGRLIKENTTGPAFTPAAFMRYTKGGNKAGVYIAERAPKNSLVFVSGTGPVTPDVQILKNIQIGSTINIPSLTNIVTPESLSNDEFLGWSESYVPNNAYSHVPDNYRILDNGNVNNIHVLYGMWVNGLNTAGQNIVFSANDDGTSSNSSSLQTGRGPTSVPYTEWGDFGGQTTFDRTYAFGYRVPLSKPGKLSQINLNEINKYTDNTRPWAYNDTEDNYSTQGHSNVFIPPVKPGFLFEGWMMVNGTTRLPVNGSITIGTTEITNNIGASESDIKKFNEKYLFIAKWKRIGPKMRFDANGGKFSDGSSQKTVYFKYGPRSIASGIGDVPTRPGYILAGWTKQKFDPGDKVTETPVNDLDTKESDLDVNANEVSYYANWTKTIMDEIPEAFKFGMYNSLYQDEDHDYPLAKSEYEENPDVITNGFNLKFRNGDEATFNVEVKGDPLKDDRTSDRLENVSIILKPVVSVVRDPMHPNLEDGTPRRSELINGIYDPVTQLATIPLDGSSHPFVKTDVIGSTTVNFAFDSVKLHVPAGTGQNYRAYRKYKTHLIWSFTDLP